MICAGAAVVLLAVVADFAGNSVEVLSAHYSKPLASDLAVVTQVEAGAASVDPPGNAGAGVDAAMAGSSNKMLAMDAPPYHLHAAPGFSPTNTTS